MIKLTHQNFKYIDAVVLVLGLQYIQINNVVINYKNVSFFS